MKKIPKKDDTKKQIQPSENLKKTLKRTKEKTVNKKQNKQKTNKL